MEELIVSADSHVIEVPDLWEKGMPASLRDRAPREGFFSTKSLPGCPVSQRRGHSPFSPSSSIT